MNSGSIIRDKTQGIQGYYKDDKSATRRGKVISLLCLNLVVLVVLVCLVYLVQTGVTHSGGR